MSNYKISLHGGNYVSASREKAFKAALDDNHTIQSKTRKSGNGKLADPDNFLKMQPGPTPDVLPKQADHNSQGLKHSISHQNRTLDVHQQYLDQQDEYLALIQDLVQQQGRIIDNSNADEAESLIRQLQQSLTALNAVQDRGLEIHERFLDQQAKFSSDLVRLVQNQGTTQSQQEEPRESLLSKRTTQSPDPIKESSEPLDNDLQDKLETESPISSPQTESGVQIDSSTENLSNLPDEEELSRSLLAIVADKTGYPAEMLELEMDLEADLGVDSIKRVEILGSVEEQYPELPEADTQILAETRTLQDIVEYFKLETGRQSVTQASAVESTNKPENEFTPQSHPENPAVDAGDLTAQLLAIVADKTGYPVEMLEPEMDMEADLGIDSIKRVEILGAMEEQNPDLPAVKNELLAELRTLTEVIDFLTKEADVDVTEPVSEKKKLSPGVKIEKVERISLPDPDWLELETNQDKPLLLVSADTSTARDLINAIHNSAYPAVWIKTKTGNQVQDNYEQIQDLPTYNLKSSGDQVIQDLISNISSEHGNPAGVILNPESSGLRKSNGNEYEAIQTAFFFAKHLQPFLQSQPSGERRIFMIVIRHNGQLGLGSSAELNPALGLSGLVKTLHWEWPEVFTRLVDLDSALGKNISGQYLLQEMHDPDVSLVEVGRSRDGRTTLAPLAGRVS